MDKEYTELLNYFNTELKKEPEKKYLDKKESPFKDIYLKKAKLNDIPVEDDEIDSYYYKHNANDIFIPKVYAINCEYKDVMNDLKETQNEIFKSHELKNNFSTDEINDETKNIENIPKDDLKIYQEYYEGCKEIEISESYALKGGYLATEILEALKY